MAENDRRVYTGRSRDTPPTLESAIEDAYEKAKTVRAAADLSPEFELRIVEIRVKGSNPITDYRVDATD
jgi:hypothetical protein